MLRDTAQLYEAMIERDAGGIRQAVGSLRDQASSEEILDSIVRFAVLAFCPSEHSKGALAAAVAARTIAPTLGQLDALSVECAIYAADARAPWSEPPIGEPPAVGSEQRDDLDEIAAAINASDRLRGERWLAAALARDDFPEHYFDAAALTLRSSAHGFIVAVNAWRIAATIPRQHWYATLRLVIEEWTRNCEADATVLPSPPAARDVLQHTVRFYEAGEASPLAFQHVSLFDAAEAVEGVADRARAIVLAHLMSSSTAGATSDIDPASDAPVYRLARDYAAYLQSIAIAQRLAEQHDGGTLERIKALAQHNLRYSESYEEWSLA